MDSNPWVEMSKAYQEAELSASICLAYCDTLLEAANETATRLNDKAQKQAAALRASLDYRRV